MGWFTVYQREMLLMKKKIGKLGYVFSTLLFPLIYLTAFGWGLGPVVGMEGGYLPYLVKGILAITVMLNAFQQTSLSVSVARFYFKTFQTLVLSPLSSLQIVIGLTLAGMTRAGLAGGAIYCLAMLLFDVPLPGLAGLIGLAATSFCFAALGIIIGLMVKNPDALSIVINFIITPMTFFCGSFFPVDNLPHVLRSIVKLLPLSLTNELLRLDNISAAAAADMGLLMLMGLLVFGAGVRRIENYSE